MIKRIVVYFMMAFMVVALFLSMVGVKQIGYGTQYMSFLKNTSRLYDSWKVTIPDIPKINKMYTSDGGRGFIEAIKSILNVLISFFNGVIGVINILILILNTLINILQFIISFIINIRDFIGSMKPDENGLVNSVAVLPKKSLALFWGGGFSCSTF